MTTTVTASDVFGGIWDKALGVFDKVVDFEFGKKELELARDVQLFQSAQAFESQQRQEQFSAGTSNSIVGGISNQTLLIGAAVAAVGIYLLTR